MSELICRYLWSGQNGVELFGMDGACETRLNGSDICVSRKIKPYPVNLMSE
jgi:hypothetical protein